MRPSFPRTAFTVVVALGFGLAVPMGATVLPTVSAATTSQPSAASPNIICQPGGTCGSVQYFIPGSWWGYPWDHNTIVVGQWQEGYVEKGVIGCIVTGAITAAIPVGGEITAAGLAVACLTGGTMSVAGL